MLDIAVLRFIWWVLLGVLFMGFAVTDGFDFGVASLMPLVTRNEKERLSLLSAILPFWEGNQVWIIVGAGAMFAAWPYVYAVAFSGIYFPMLLLLLTMGISRPVAFKFREKVSNILWRRCWDVVIVLGGVVPSFLFGVLVGNILIGLPFSFDQTLRLTYTIQLSQLFNPFSLWCGCTSLAMLMMHGGLYLAIKTYDPIRARAIFWARVATIALLIFFTVGGFWTKYFLAGYQVVSAIDPYGYSNPLHKTVTTAVGAWMHNYTLYPFTKLIPLTGLIGAMGAFLMAGNRLAFIFSGISIASIIGTVGVSMFPFILPSSSDLTSSLLVWDSSSTQLTLLLMLITAIIFLPIISIYTTWVYRVMRGNVSRG